MADKNNNLKKPGPSFWILAGLQTLLALFIVAFALAPPLQREVMKNMHLTTDNYGVWMILQTFPKMYNFDNEVWRVGFTHDEDPPVTTYRVNHYPIRELTFNLTPNRVAHHDFTGELWSRSTYRSTCLLSVYKMARHPDIDDLVTLRPIQPSDSIFSKESHPTCP